MDTATLRPHGCNLVESYASRFRPEMVDLSSPAPAAAFTWQTHGEMRLDFPTVGGSWELRSAIARLYRTLGPNDILVTSGASEALAALAAVCGQRRYRIAAAGGAYPTFTEVATLAGAQLVDDRSLAGVDAYLFTNPTVPDGKRIDVAREVARAIAAGALPVVDEVYRHIALDGCVPEAAADIDPTAVSVDDLSKPLGLGGLRIGWVATRNHEVLAAVGRWLRLFTGGPSVLSDAAALEALTTFDSTVAMHAAAAGRNSVALYALLRGAGWRAEPAELGLTVCAYPPVALSPDDLATLGGQGLFLLDAALLGRPGGVRLGLLTPPDTLRRALQLLNTGPRTRRRDALVVLMRVPQRGTGKSRLAATLGEERTLAIARAFVADTLRLACSGSWAQVVALTPADAIATVSEMVPDACVIAQTDGDLGERIRSALEEGLRHAERAVLIGSDTPDLPLRVIDQAFRTLDDADAVIGPATDGGFYLLGVRTTERSMFGGVRWSTSGVFTQTLANLRRLRWRVAVLEPWQDVDDESSLRALAGRLRRGCEARATAAVIEAVLGEVAR